MKILITGIAGFIGSHTAERLLLQGHSIVGIDNFTSYYDVNLKRHTAEVLTKKGITIFPLDLKEKDIYTSLSTDFDYIFHFAAQPGIATISTFDDYLFNNFIATHYLLEFALQNKNLQQFVNISTSSVYGVDASYNELTIPKPVSAYGVTKLAAEQLALSFSREKKIKACSLRLYSVYGPRERPDKLYPKLITAALLGKTFSLFEGSGKHLRSFTFIDDIVDGIISVIGKEAVTDGEIFNLGTDIENSTQDGIDLVEELLSIKINRIIVPKRAGDQMRTSAVIDKARVLLNYSPSTTLREGVEKHIVWYKNNPELLK